MKNQKSCLTLLVLGIILFHAPCVLAASTLLNYQGTLLDEKGTPVSGRTLEMTFRIYTVEDHGTAIWEEARQVVVQDGSYYVLLGTVHPLDASCMEGSPCWIETEVAGEKPAPRQQIVTAPVASGRTMSGSMTAAQGRIADSEPEPTCYSKQEVDATIAAVQSILLAQQARIGKLQDLTLTQQGQIATLLKLAESQQVQITAQAGEITGLYGLTAGLQGQEVPGHFQSDSKTPRWAMNRSR